MGDAPAGVVGIVGVETIVDAAVIRSLALAIRAPLTRSGMKLGSGAGKAKAPLHASAAAVRNICSASDSRG
jgi:hypothetical protein